MPSQHSHGSLPFQTSRGNLSYVVSLLHAHQAVQDDIMNCIENKAKPVMWLNGAAGAGKSAIGRPIVERCLALGIPISRFFFFRTDPTRNGLKPVVATLAYQLIETIPELQSIIIPKIQRDALIFNKSIETQFETLIFSSLVQLQGSSTEQKTVVFLLDGIDECIGHSEQAKLIQTITNFVRKQCFPLIAFFGGRAENQLCAEFRSPVLSDILLQLPLDTDYRADEDILLFLSDSFQKIKSTHPFGRELRDSNWPAQADINEIMRKASGQFIYASAVIKFVSSPHRHPALQLEIVRGLRPAGNLTPFAQLDALYRHIFSQVDDIDRTSFILAWAIFGVDGLYPKVQSFFGMHLDSVRVLLAELASVVAYEDGRVHFLHLSLPDFLLDQARSQEYYLDKKIWCTRLCIHCFHRISAGLSIGM